MSFNYGIYHYISLYLIIYIIIYIIHQYRSVYIIYLIIDQYIMIIIYLLRIIIRGAGDKTYKRTGGHRTDDEHGGGRWYERMDNQRQLTTATTGADGHRTDADD